MKATLLLSITLAGLGLANPVLNLDSNSNLEERQYKGTKCAPYFGCARRCTVGSTAEACLKRCEAEYPVYIECNGGARPPAGPPAGPPAK